MQSEETANQTRDLPITGGKTLPLAPGPPFPNKAKWTCPITNRQLAASDVIDTAVRIGEQTVLFLPTSEGSSNLQRISTSISFDVIERTELASMNESTHDRLLFRYKYFVN